MGTPKISKLEEPLTGAPPRSIRGIAQLSTGLEAMASRLEAPPNLLLPLCLSHFTNAADCLALCLGRLISSCPNPTNMPRSNICVYILTMAILKGVLEDINLPCLPSCLVCLAPGSTGWLPLNRLTNFQARTGWLSACCVWRCSRHLCRSRLIYLSIYLCFRFCILSMSVLLRIQTDHLLVKRA